MSYKLGINSTNKEREWHEEFAKKVNILKISTRGVVLIRSEKYRKISKWGAFIWQLRASVIYKCPCGNCSISYTKRTFCHDTIRSCKCHNFKRRDSLVLFLVVGLLLFVSNIQLLSFFLIATPRLLSLSFTMANQTLSVSITVITCNINSVSIINACFCCCIYGW